MAYADDVALIVETQMRVEMLRTSLTALDHIISWSWDNKLKISQEKTVFLVNRSPSRVHHRDIRLQIDVVKIKRVLHHMYLGIIIDPKL